MMDEDKEFTPRAYQEELLRIAMKTNTILYLPTGSGKTYIAVMLIKELSPEICTSSYADGDKRTIFIVNTVTLVNQQADYLRKYTDLSVGAYSGDSQCDFWNESEWYDEISKYNVLVMTAQILVNIVQHGFFDLARCNLLIFDECHHAVDDHPMRIIMDQHYSTLEPENAPKILGLTATLLNRNVKPHSVMQEVSILERTYNAKIATVEALNVVLGYSTNPKESISKYTELTKTPAIVEIDDMITNLMQLISDIQFVKETPMPSTRAGFIPLLEGSDVNRKIKNSLKNIQSHLTVFGLYGGSKSVLSHIIQYERIKRHLTDEPTFRIIQILITQLTVILKRIEDVMSVEANLLNKILKFSSSKVLTLIQLVRENLSNSLCSIIFVERRFTSKVLYHIFKNLAKSHPDFELMKPNFIVGYNHNPYNDTRESVYDRKQNNQVMHQFKLHELNLLFSTNVLEEGLDVPQCTLVVMFDLPTNYRSYIQSKGRARHASSNYIILCNANDRFESKLHQYREIELILQRMLVNNINIDLPVLLNDEEMDLDENDSLIKSYTVESTGACVTIKSSIPIINRYCSSLPQDMFTTLAPLWYKNIRGNCNNYENACSKVQVILELPIVSTVRQDIIGPYMFNLKDAKRAAALVGVRMLHQAGELNDNLLPVTKEKIMEDVEYMFDWENEVESADLPKVGTKSRRRHYVKRCPEALVGVCPEDEHSEVYIHVIEFTPMYAEPNDANPCQTMFYNNYKSKQTFAILTSHPLPSVCDFPIYQRCGEIRVRLLVNIRVEPVSKQNLAELKRFHSFIFAQVLNGLKPFLIFDHSNGESSYLIVPVDFDSSKQRYFIDFETVVKYKSLESVEEPTVQIRRSINVTDKDYLGAVVYPWYRTRNIGYIVCEVTHKLNALSKFPSDEFDTFMDYYIDKWNLKAVNPEQPLLLVKAMTTRLNYLKPRGETKNGYKRKTYENEDIGEHFLPEFCIRMSFPSLLWLKAKCVPSVLHRVHYLLLADELRHKINKECKIGCLERNSLSMANGDQSSLWQPLKGENYLLNYNDDYQDKNKEEIENSVYGRQSPIGELLDMKKLEFQVELTDNMQYPWKEDQEPIDIERNIDSVTLYEIEYYDNFVSQKLTGDFSAYEYYNKTLTPKNSPVKLAITYEDNSKDFNIKILDKQKSNPGPELWQVYQSITASSALEIVNLERFEILGDSFLKFSTSWYLFCKYPKWNEGYLTFVKGRLVGNKNLFFRGREKQLGNIMKVNDFEPTSDWIPPKFSVPRNLKDNQIDVEQLSFNILFNLSIPIEEQMSGELSKETRRNLEERLDTALSDKIELNSSMEDYICQQLISDKTISDCVEALIGCYLCSNGVDGAFSLLEWFEVLPPQDKPSELMYCKYPSPLLEIAKNATLKDIECRIPNWRKLETILNYSFNNKAYLLQALTHSSYNINRLTDCYQRLEFIGDAILDFLITSYIFEQCGEHMTPGDITDLRSALVNNVVFASLTVKYDFHKYLQILNPKLTDVIFNFVRHQEERKFVINDEVLILLEEGDYNIGEYIDVPKVLGDVFESIAGAIFLDSGLNLKKVWNVFYPLMKQQIDEFSRNIPKNPIRLLYEKVSANPKFCNIDATTDGKLVAKLSFYIDGQKKLVYGFGDNKKQAKFAAAKIALRAINANKKIDEINS